MFIHSLSPTSPQWQGYLALYADYLRRYWPQRFAPCGVESLQREIETDLLERWRQGGRGFLLLAEGDTAHGLANLWLDRESSGTILQIAEFHIRPGKQRQGYGRQLWSAALRWGREQGAIHIALQADTSNLAANAFWTAMGLDGHALGTERVSYRGRLPTDEPA